MTTMLNTTDTPPDLNSRIGRLPYDATDEEAREQRVQEIVSKSAEGRPAHPEMSSSMIIFLIAITLACIASAATVIGLLVSPMLGVVSGVLATLLLLFNPATWAAILRARERRDLPQQR